MIDFEWKAEGIDLYMIDCNTFNANDPEVMEFLDRVVFIRIYMICLD